MFSDSVGNSIPPCLLSDSYKATHPLQYPPAKKVRRLAARHAQQGQRVAYGEFRSSFDGDPNDHRIVFYGIRYLIDTYVCRRWTADDLSATDRFLATHKAGFTPMPYPRDLFRRIVDECGGYIPVRVEALEEGSVVYPHVPVYVLTAQADFAGLVTFLETILTMVWYPSTVATLSRRCRDLIEQAFRETADPERHALVDSRLHDFGFRGCTSVEQAVIGGAAHLLNFAGTDTMAAAYYVQHVLNEGRPVGTSIPASEHSVMTAFRDEKALSEAIRHLIDLFGDDIFACVMDSYDYLGALGDILPAIAAYKVQKKGVMVLRPDSGEPSSMVVLALQAAARVFGADHNTKGFKVLRGCGVIHGDGINYDQIRKILAATADAGFSAENVAFGMGSNLLQRVNRDSMSFATKLCCVVEADGTKRDVCKTPKTDPAKFSLPGELAVLPDSRGVPQVHCKEDVSADELATKGLLKVWYDHGPVCDPALRPAFDRLKAKVSSQWASLPAISDVISACLRAKVRQLHRQT